MATTSSLTTVALAELVKATRDAQKAYFRARRRGDGFEATHGFLAESRRLEKELDEALGRVLDPPTRREPLPGQTSFLDD